MSQASDRDIRRVVSERYAATARGVLAGSGASAAGAACCAPADGDASAGTATIEFVEIDAERSRQYGAANYDAASVADLPESVSGASLGCGNPLAIAELAEGEVVLDLGSGGGIDCFLAAKQVGPEGRVWGLDMTPDMIALARHNAEQVGADNVRFRLGEIEDIPFDDATFDVLMSNCVINLSTDKPQVFREAFRVLKPGGRLRVSDMVWTHEPPEATAENLDQWAGCVAGALEVEDYLDAIRAAGFVDVAAEHEDGAQGVVSAAVSARRPD